MNKTVKTEKLLQILHAVVSSSYISAETGNDFAEHVCKRIFCAMMPLMELTDAEEDAVFAKAMEIAQVARAMTEKEMFEETVQ